jgi:hypothetical protein
MTFNLRKSNIIDNPLFRDSPRFKDKLDWFHTVQFVNLWYALYADTPLRLFDDHWHGFAKFEDLFERSYIDLYNYYRGF